MDGYGRKQLGYGGESHGPDAYAFLTPAAKESVDQGVIIDTLVSNRLANKPNSPELSQHLKNPDIADQVQARLNLALQKASAPKPALG